MTVLLKKIGAIVLILMVSFVSTVVLFVSMPYNAEALVPVFDVVNNPKELVLDTIAKATVKILITDFTNAVANWLRTGDAFRGGPLFVTDFDQFLFNAADNAAGLFLEEYLSTETYSALCRPFRAQVFRALAQGYPRYPSSLFSFSSLARCSLTDIVESVENFYQSFENGGWPAWFAQARPANNYYGLRLLARNESRMRQFRASTEARHDFQTGSGFIASQICLEQAEYTFVDDDDPGVEEKRTECVRTLKETIGSAVKSELESTVLSDVLGLNLADEFEEVIFAALDGLFSILIHGTGSSATVGTVGIPSGLLGADLSTIVPTDTNTTLLALPSPLPDTWHCEGDGGGGSVSADGGSGGTTGAGGTGGSGSVALELSNEQDCETGPPADVVYPKIPGCTLPDCQSMQEPTMPACSDGIDNDFDGFCDTAYAECPPGITPGDPDCTSGVDQTESSCASAIGKPPGCDCSPFILNICVVGSECIDIDGDGSAICSFP